jgi:hypothetical protein
MRKVDIGALYRCDGMGKCDDAGDYLKIVLGDEATGYREVRRISRGNAEILLTELAELLG